MLGGGALFVLLTSGSAWAVVSQALASSSQPWRAPTINYLSEESNLFRPGDRPRSDHDVSCTSVNRGFTNGRTRSYWGTDNGLSYVSEEQRNWPLRDHGFAADAFSYDEYLDAPWVDRWIDPITGSTLSNNRWNCGVSGYEAHHIVSFATWDASSFGGIIPSTLRSWNLHNKTGIIWGAYGAYYCTNSSVTTMPPDGTCTFEGLTASARITCFSTEAVHQGDDCLLRYCLYFFIDASSAAQAFGSTVDCYGGTTYVNTLAAGIACQATVTGLEQVASVLLRNIFRMVYRKLPDETVCASLTGKVSEGSLTVCEAISSLFDSSLSAPDCPNETAAERLAYALLQVEADAQLRSDLAMRISGEGLGAASTYLLESACAAGTLGYPIASPQLQFSVTDEDAFGEKRTLTCTGGEAQTPLAYNYGDYGCSLCTDTQGWGISGNGQTVINIPDNASGTRRQVDFDVAPVGLPREVGPDVTVTLVRDLRGTQANSEKPDTLECEAFFGLPFDFETQAPGFGKRIGCSEWSNWCTDEACTTPYGDEPLEGDMTLYCENYVSIAWALSENALALEAQSAQTLWKDEECSEQTRLADLLPQTATSYWGDFYDVLGLPPVWTEHDGITRRLDGSSFRDIQSKTPTGDVVRILRDTTLYADWSDAPFDGVRIS